MKPWIGTSGYSYKEWKGPFYPEDLSADRMLHYYGERFRSVEINNTFYRMPSSKVLAGWAEQVPEGFCFVLKASRRITHHGRLKDVGDSVDYLFEKAASLGDKLGPVLFQLPPFLRHDLDRLKSFLELLPEGRRVAMEFRHRSWFDEPVYEVLRSRDVALCVGDGELKGEGEVPFVSTASWGYLRLRHTGYDGDSLADWAARIQGQEWSDAFVFFKHEDEGAGPNLAARFMELF